MKVYRIRDKETGLFSTGGAHPKWSTKGKLWRSAGNLRSHLTTVLEYKGYEKKAQIVPENWEVIEYELTETQISIYSAPEFHENKSPPAKAKKLKWVDEGVGLEAKVGKGVVARITQSHSGFSRYWWSIGSDVPWTPRTKQGRAVTLEEAKKAVEEAIL